MLKHNYIVIQTIDDQLGQRVETSKSKKAKANNMAPMTYH